MESGSININSENKFPGITIVTWGQFIDEVDRECKKDLNNNLIFGERDYCIRPSNYMSVNPGIKV